MKFSVINKCYLFCTMLLLLHTNAIGQEDLNKLLEGKTKFPEITQIVEQYFDQHPELKSEEGDEESPYMHWNRWVWYMSGRLGPQGELVNVPALLMQGLAEKEK